jgi:alpha-L-fucosidase
MPTGEIETRQVERLKEMGAWMKKYGATIYGTRGGPYTPTKRMASTHKGHTIYVHVLAWSGDSLTLAPIPAKVVESLAVTGGDVKIAQSDAGIEISLPKANRQAIDTIVALELDKPASEIAPLPGTGDDAPAMVKKATSKKKPAKKNDAGRNATLLQKNG